MSRVLVHRLSTVRDEFDATRKALAHVNRNWQRLNIAGDMVGLSRERFDRTARAVETIVMIRLFSTFEGVLKEHLASNHAHIAVPDDAQSVWLINRAANLQTPHIGRPLVDRIHAIRLYRSRLVHPAGVIANPITFVEALSALARYCDRLPDPL